MAAFEITLHLRIRSRHGGALVGFFLAGRNANGDARRVVARTGSGSYFGLERDSMRPYHLWCIQTRNIRKREGGREGGDGHKRRRE
jgi:hypothetical protein